MANATSLDGFALSDDLAPTEPGQRLVKNHRFVARSSIAAPPNELADWHLRRGAFERLCPPWERVEVIEPAWPLVEGARAVLRVRIGPLRLRWVVRHRGFEAGRQFQDVQEQGPFAQWIHTHRFLPEGNDCTLLEDEIEYAFPLGRVGSLLAEASTRARLQRAFTYRHALTAADLARHRAVAGRAPLALAVTGASGLVGRPLVAFLESGGHRVQRLVRRAPAGESEILWDPALGRIDAAALEGIDGVIHLAGENIAAARWSPRQKARILESRVRGTELIARTLAALDRPPRVLVSASAVGYYGDRGDEPLDEDSPAGSGFLAETCRAWEEATAAAASAGIRVVHLRIGAVLGARGGALQRIVPPFRLGLGGRIGDGRQFMSWVALDDVVGIVHRALHDERLAGAVNAVAPTPCRNADFTRTLGRVLGRPTPFPLPAALLRLGLGEMADAVLLGGAHVEPRRLERVGFPFRFTELEPALRWELGRFD